MTKRVRCAIYTRKSTEEGLEQEFNSLDAQREACEAYIRSQTGEGWNGLPARYDDGGYSGGNLDRPAMQRLLADIDAGKVDIIVVYKVDRLTRSLMDFAKIVERLDARGVSFVSITQAFNTTTSMGRLTLNVLLSFAQFEREVTGERIRDKIAASKAKGMWMGGNIPLGYDLQERRLVVNTAEADQVRHIFTRYLGLGSGVALMKELRRDGILSKRWTSRSGKEHGGKPFSCGALYYLLQNRLYLGEIVHRGVVHDGEHEAIVSKQLFDEVQAALAENRKKRREAPKRKDECWLAGFARDADGKVMTTSFSYGRGGRLYRYYVSGSLDPGPDSPKPARRVPAARLERLVLHTLSSLFQRSVTSEDALSLLDRVELRDRSIQIVVDAGALLEPHEPAAGATSRLQAHIEPHRVAIEGNLLRTVVDRQPVFRGGRLIGRVAVEAANGDAISLLRSAHRLLREHSMSPTEPQEHRRARAPSWQRQRRVMALGLLAPAVQKAILKGKRSESLELLAAERVSLAWADQV
ncbi:recombinase family protein [Sphingomonas sabuli]|uniref:Recombinase family protein n=1 Tax=Sphingomonas sabuli TaxID=2764186 RepID=A0A7G9L1W4_9SPHN|nr:recombinase family protein [Sphingomonas sabuli]QNM82613.1 recombinase family protein [Sphingomonas sabuli]